MTNQPKSLRTAAFLLAAVLATSCFVGGTLARYTTSTTSQDQARVAIWGINGDTVTMELFDSEYDLNGNKVAKSWNGDKIIAPGTNMASKFSIVNLDDTLAPEVMYEIKIDVDDTEIDQRILDNPSIQWKLDDNSWGTWESTKTDILALSGDASGVKTYQALEIADEFANGKEHTIAWQWKLDDNNVQDTEMGNDAVSEDLIANISIKVTARQVTVDSTGMLDGDNSVYDINEPTTLTFRSVAPIEEFQSVKIGDETLTRDIDYTVTEGSTVITLKKDYLSTLAEGNYIISIISDSITAKATFKVAKVKEITASLNHSGIIPEGGIYYSGLKQTCGFPCYGDYENCEIDTKSEECSFAVYEYEGDYSTAETIYTAGQPFPEVQLGDVYVYDGYEYRYGAYRQYYDEWWYVTDNPTGWAAFYLWTSDKTPGDVLESISNIPITNMNQAFYMKNITSVPKIPSTVTSMDYMLYNLSNLTGSIELNCTPTSFASALYNTNITEITGTCDENVKQEILDTKTEPYPWD